MSSENCSARIRQKNLLVKYTIITDKMDLLLRLLINSSIFFFISTVTSQAVGPKGCCYGGKTLLHGTAVITDPHRCFQLVCENGLILPKYVQKKGDMNCCQFNDRLYPHGKQLGGHCMLMECTAGSWESTGTIEECCDHCYLYNDPHIVTFDGNRYDWHGTCNYSVAQSHFSTKPDVGVFSDFSVCNGFASCLSHTTFRNDPHTILTLDNGAVTQLNVNGHENIVQEEVQPVRCENGKQRPVLSWKHENCVFLMGSSRLLLLHCPHRLDIWAHPANAGKLNGLCGHYNNHQSDDFTDRNGDVHSPLSYWPMAFPYSWLTSEQSNRLCDDPCDKCHEETTIDPCVANATHRSFYNLLCREALQHHSNVKDLNHYIDTCAFDLCLIYQSGGTERDTVSWTRQMDELISVVKDFS